MPGRLLSMDHPEEKLSALLVGASRDSVLLGRLEERLQLDGVAARSWTLSKSDRGHVASLQDGFTSSNILLVVISKQLLLESWAWLEQASLPFRDSPGGRRWFVPITSEACDLPESIHRFRSIRWQVEIENECFARVVKACKRESQRSAESDQSVQLKQLTSRVVAAHKKEVWSSVSAANGQRFITGGGDGTIKVWEADGVRCLASFDHGEPVYAVVSSANCERVVSAAGDGVIKVWDVSRGICTATLAKHRDLVYSLALSADNRILASGSGDRTVRIWDLESGKCLKVLKGHAGEVCSVAIAPDGRKAISGSTDGAIRIWDLDSYKSVKLLRGHTTRVNRIVYVQDGARFVTASDDATLRVWEAATGRCVATLEGHPGRVVAAAALLGGSVIAAASASTRHSPSLIKIWDAENGACLVTVSQGGDDYHSYEVDDAAFYSLCFCQGGERLVAGCESGEVISLDLSQLKIARRLALTRPEVRYTNAKVVLMGESGVGKSGLALRLAEGQWVPTESTHGMRVWPLNYPNLGGESIEREVWLWDLAGQPEYRLIHQLFLDETALAVVLYDGARPDDPFYGIGHWEEALRVAVGGDLPKILVAARTDRGGPRLTTEKIEHFCGQRGYGSHLETSAKTGVGCDKLKELILGSIQWDDLPWTATTRLFKALQNAVIKLRQEGLLLLRHTELHQQTQMLQPGERFGVAELRAVVGLMAGQGLVKKLSFGDFILLQPEQISLYGAAVIQAARRHQDGIGCISEQAVLAASFDMQDLQRVSPSDESILLRALVQHFLDQSLCIKEHSPEGDLLVFPSQFNREMPVAPAPPPISGLYRFHGQVDSVFTTLVVRLTYSDCFHKGELWKDAASYRTPTGKLIGVGLNRVGEGAGEVRIFADPDASQDLQALLHKFVHEHLAQRASDVVRERQYACSSCAKPFTEPAALRFRVESGAQFVRCLYCDEKIRIHDDIEQYFGADDIEQRAFALDAEATRNLDNESKDLILVGEATAITGQAGHIFREMQKCDHGIDAEIEFKNRLGEASGQRIYLQLKSGDSYLYERKSDDELIFNIKNRRHIHYWQNQPCPVYLVHRTSDGETRWMNISKYLKERQEKESLQVIFRGVPFNSYSLAKLRDELVP